MSKKPYLKIARKFFESTEWTTPRTFSEAEAWLDMIFLASFATHDIDLGKDGILTLHRGEFYYTQRQLSQRWGWPLSKVNRLLARYAEGLNPRIEKIQRETHFETQSETQVETQITIVRLCNYDSYNKADLKNETQNETQNETHFETLNNKGINNKGDNKTHTHFMCLQDLFVRACWRVHESAEACAEACKTCEEILLYCGQDDEELFEFAMHERQYRDYKSGVAKERFNKDLEAAKAKAGAPIIVTRPVIEVPKVDIEAIQRQYPDAIPVQAPVKGQMLWGIDVDDASSAPVVGTQVTAGEPMGYVQTYYGMEEILPLSDGRIAATLVKQGENVVKGEIVAFIQK